MNILFICDEYPPGKNGGIGTVVQVLGRELVRQGHKVVVAGLYSYGYGQKEYEEDQGVKVWRLRYGYKLGTDANSLAYKIFNKIPNGIKQHLNGRQAFANFIAFINTLIDQEQIAIMEVPDWNTFALRIGFIVDWPPFKIPLVVKSHGSYTKLCHDLGQKPKASRAKTDQQLYERADALVAVSNDTARVNKMLFHVHKPIATLYNGIELPPAPAQQERETGKIIYTGSLTAAKGIYALLKAWKYVLAEAPQATLHVFGKGDTQSLLALLDAQEQKSVTFYGHVARTVLREQLQTASAGVFPSYSEAFGLGVVEAMSEGCPVVYTKRSCGPEIVEHMKEGILVDPDNTREIADAILLILKDKTFREEIGRRGYEKVKQQFDSIKIAQQHEAYYKSVIARQPPA